MAEKRFIYSNDYDDYVCHEATEEEMEFCRTEHDEAWKWYFDKEKQERKQENKKNKKRKRRRKKKRGRHRMNHFRLFLKDPYASMKKFGKITSKKGKML